MRMLLVDITLITQNCSPYEMEHAVNFEDNLSEVFKKTGQSLIAAAHICRDQRMFSVRSAGNGWFCHFWALGVGMGFFLRSVWDLEA